MSAIQAIKDYLSRMIGDIAGMKALYLDQETAGIVSMVLSQTQLLEKEIFLMRTLDKNVDSKIEEHFHLKAIIFVRPSSENVREIVKLISEQTFCEFHLFFSNIIHRDLLRSIASADQNDVVVEVHEIFADYFAVNNDLWTVNVRNTKYLLSEPIVGKDLARFNRIVDGIFANVLSFRSKPLIRYQGSSKLCKKIGDHVMEKIEQSFDMFDNKSIDEDVLLLIVDRREDPVTPLLTQWTYQAMIHELIGLENNKVDITPLLRKLHKKDHKAMKEKVDQRVFVLSQDQDQFFKKTMRLNYGDLGVAIKELVEDFQRKKDDRSKIDTIEDLQKIVENYDKIVSESGAVAKHVTLMTELSNIIDKRDLLKVSALEQRLACEQNHAVAVEEVRTLLNDTSISFKDKLKVVMLYALRYESVKNEIPAFKSMLRDLAMSDNSRRMIHVKLFRSHHTLFSIGLTTFTRLVY